MALRHVSCRCRLLTLGQGCPSSGTPQIGDTMAAVRHAITFFRQFCVFVRAVIEFVEAMRASSQNQPQKASVPKVKPKMPPSRSQNTSGKQFVLIQDPSLFVQRGWVQNGNTYKGYYRTPYGAWRGEIIRRGHKFRVFIIDPPILQLKKHPEKAPCIHIVNRRKAEVDLHKQPRDHDVGAIILYVETLIVESFQQ